MVFLVWGDSLLWYLLVGPCAEESSMFGYSIAGLSGTGFSTLVTGLVFMWQQDIIWQNRSSLHGLRYNFDYTCIGLWGSQLPVFLNLLTPDSIGFAEFQHQTGPTGNSRFRMTTTVMGQFLDVACICREVLLNPVEIHWIDFTKISWTHWHIYFVATYSYCNGNALVSGRHGTCKLLALIARSEEMPWTNQTKSATKSRSWANYNHCTGRPSHKPFYTSGNHPQDGLESFGYPVSFVQWRVIRHRQTLMPTENTCRKIMGWDTL